ncbi:uncharacterized protein LOC117245066 [Parus major]|uniref:uncharacterized protein LOC117245066 n=1 Tax=Parus major TaxID=9157 RepID=UPI00108AF9AE|nr:uncharacterized protein LOC117245066 [Parus major]
MGGCVSKKMSTKRDKRAKNIPPNSPLEKLLDKWDDWEVTKELDKIKMIHFCVEVWPNLNLPERWPWVGTQDLWMCRQLNEHLKAQDGSDLEEIRYAACWLENVVRDREMKICTLQHKGERSREKEENGKKWDPLDYLPPPDFPAVSQSAPLAPSQVHVTPPTATLPLPPPPFPMTTVPITPSPVVIPLSPPNWDLSKPASPLSLSPLQTSGDPPPTVLPQSDTTTSPQQGFTSQADGPKADDGPYCNTRSKTFKAERLFPLREVPMGGAAGGIGFVNVPLTASEVRSFKKEIGNLVEDPVGIANQVDQFLVPNTYTWGELNSIFNIPFSPEEVRLIRMTGIWIWERENIPGPPGDQKIPIADPNWNPNEEEGRRNIREYRSLMVRGIKESVPRGSNTKLAFDGSQEKDETLAAWLNWLKRNFQLHSNIDPDGPEGQMLLKVQFVTRSCPDIRRKLEKMEGWQEKDINELLRESPRVYLWTEEEKTRTKAKIMVAVARESAGSEKGALAAPSRERPGPAKPWKWYPERTGKPWVRRCFYCNEVGHFQKDCKKLQFDEAIAREQDLLKKVLKGDD